MSGRQCAAADHALRLWLAGGITKIEACRVAGVSRMTLDRALARSGNPQPTLREIKQAARNQ